MKLLFVIFILFLSFDCMGQSENVYNNENINIKDVMEENGLLFYKMDTTLVTGRVVRYNKKGKIKLEILIIEGRLYEADGIHNKNQNPTTETTLWGEILTGVLGAVKQNNVKQ